MCDLEDVDGEARERLGEVGDMISSDCVKTERQVQFCNVVGQGYEERYQ